MLQKVSKEKEAIALDIANRNHVQQMLKKVCLVVSSLLFQPHSVSCPFMRVTLYL
jgi:hypothetical protein